MAVTNRNYRYDHPTYTCRHVGGGGGGVVAAGTLVPAAHLDAAQKLNLYKFQGYITAAGTVGTALMDAIKVEGTTTTTMATTTVGTTAAKGTYIIDLTTDGSAPTALAAGGYAYVVSRLDATLASRGSWEFAAAIDGNVCGPA